MRGIIYCYTSPSGKKYIGQTINEKHRRDIFLNIKMKYSSGGKIDKARKKYGPENFKYDVIEIIEADNKNTLLKILNSFEIYYIHLYNSFKNGYNSCIGGENHGRKFTQEERNYRSDFMKKICQGKQPEHLQNCWKEGLFNSIELSKKKVRQYSLDGIFVKEWNSISDATRALSKNLHISDCCLHKLTQTGGYVWRFSEEESGNKIITNVSKRGLNKKWNIEVYNNGNFIKKYTYINEGVLDLFGEISDSSVANFHKILIWDSVNNKWIIKYNDC